MAVVLSALAIASNFAASVGLLLRCLGWRNVVSYLTIGCGFASGM